MSHTFLIWVTHTYCGSPILTMSHPYLLWATHTHYESPILTMSHPYLPWAHTHYKSLILAMSHPYLPWITHTHYKSLILTMSHLYLLWVTHTHYWSHTFDMNHSYLLNESSIIWRLAFLEDINLAPNARPTASNFGTGSSALTTSISPLASSTTLPFLYFCNNITNYLFSNYITQMCILCQTQHSLKSTKFLQISTARSYLLVATRNIWLIIIS